MNEAPENNNLVRLGVCEQPTRMLNIIKCQMKVYVLPVHVSVKCNYRLIFINIENTFIIILNLLFKYYVQGVN